MEKKITINNIAELTIFVKNFLQELNASEKGKDKATVLALSGDLGAGKTTFVKCLAMELGVEEVVTSPTFTIMKTYETGAGQTFKYLVHMDAYRIDDLEELRPLRLAEILSTAETLVVIEWAEKIDRSLPSKVIKMNFEILSDQIREITFEM